MKKSVRLLLTAFLFLAAGSAHSAPILLGSGSFGGSDYDVYADRGISWIGAGIFAYRQGGYLTTLTSAAEDSFVTNLLRKLGLGEAWAGGFQRRDSTGPADGWNWVNGEGAFDYTNWTANEPNDYYGPGSEQFLGINWRTGTWNDEGALGNIKGFVVESVATVPEPSIFALFAAGIIGLGIARRRARI